VTIIEVLILIAIVLILIVLLLPALAGAKAKKLKINCVNNLKQVGLATRVWAGDHSGKYPPQISATDGGSMEFSTGPTVFRHFQVMSNELSTPKILICSIDPTRVAATNFILLNNSNVSFFFGVEAAETHPASLFAGEYNITNGAPLNDAVLEVTTNRPAGWTRELHKNFGYVVLADGSVMQTTDLILRKVIAKTGLGTNRLQMPILNP
jgi:hypothetical protein